MEVQDLSGASQVSAGGYHACAVMSGGEVKCWGNGDEGQLGDGSDESFAVPTEVQGLTTATQVSAGTYHTCAVLSSGRVKCWGYGAYGAAR